MNKIYIYRDGQLDKLQYAKVQGGRALRLIGAVSYITLESLHNGLEQMQPK